MKYITYFRILFLILLCSTEAQAQLVMPPVEQVAWNSYINSSGSPWLTLSANRHWGAATSKNRMLPADTSGLIQYSLGRPDCSAAFGFNYTANDDDTIQDMSLYVNNIDAGFVYHESNLYVIISGKLMLVAEGVEQHLDLAVTTDRHSAKYYINREELMQVEFEEARVLHATLMLGAYSEPTKLNCNFSYPLELYVAKSHVTTEAPSSGVIALAVEGGLKPYRYFCQETGSADALQSSLQSGTYHVMVKDSLNDSLLVTVDLAVLNNWRVLRNMAISDTGYVNTGSDSLQTGAAISHHVIGALEDGFCEVTIAENTRNIAFGFLSFWNDVLAKGYDKPYVPDQEIHSLLAFADSLLLDTAVLRTAEAYKQLSLVYFQDGLVKIGFDHYTRPDTGLISYQPGDIFKMAREENNMRLYKNQVLIAEMGDVYYSDQNLLSAVLISKGSGLVLGSASFGLANGIKGALAAELLCENVDLNWVQTRSFDENGAVKSESRVYMDQIGRSIQTQAKQFSKQNTLVSEPLFDSWGRAVGQSLAAPSFQGTLCYVPDFIEGPDKVKYTASEFDNPLGTGVPGDVLDAFNALGDVNHPKSVYDGNQGKLGWYYSDQNSAEPLVAADKLPYARVEYYDNGRVRRSAGVGITLGMGSGHETHFIYTSTPATNTTPADNELNYVFPYGTYELEKNFGVYPHAVNRNLQLFKTISINPDGRDQISYTNAAGQTIATCISGAGTGCASHLEKKVLYPVATQEKLQNIYVSAAKAGTLRFAEFDGSWTPRTPSTAAVPVLEDLMNHVTLTSGTDYTYDPVSGYFSFTGNYAGKSLYLQCSYTGAVTPGYTLALTAEAEYTQWTLYFYDRKGRLLANTSPNVTDCQTLPSLVQRTSVAGNAPGTCGDGLIASIALNNDVLHASMPYAFISIAPTVQNLSVISPTLTPLFSFQPDAEKHMLDANYFAGDTQARDSSFVTVEDSMAMTYRFTIPTDSLLAFYSYLDSLETKVPANALRGKEIRYTGEYAIYGEIDGGKILPEPLLLIPYDYTVWGDGTSDSTGAARVKLTETRLKVRNGLPLDDIPDGLNTIHVKLRNPHISLNGFDGDKELYDCTGQSWLPSGAQPILNAIGHLVHPRVELEALSQPTPLSIPFANKYIYDEYNRLVGSINEDQGTVYYVYDQKEDKLLFTQNEKQRDRGGKFSCIVYDALGRPESSGEYDPANGGPTSGDTPYLFQDYYTWKSGATVPAGRISTGAAALANSSAYNDGHIFDRTWIEYDDADASLPTSFSGNSNNYTQRYTAAKVSKTWNSQSSTWYSYDEMGRQCWSVQQSSELGYKTMDYYYDFRGKLLASLYQAGQTDNIKHEYSYDADERLMSASYGVFTGNALNYMKPLVSCDYYLHGPLKRMVLGNKLQGLDYIYTIDGKLKSVNNPVNSASASDPGLDGYSTGPHAQVSPDAFSYALEYYPGDYVRSGSPVSSYNNVNVYNDNLSYTGLVKAQSWRTALPAGATTAYSKALMYEYKYDELYRLTGATFGTIDETFITPPGHAPLRTNNFVDLPEYKLENISYDENGNLQNLKRYAAPINSTTAHLLDNLKYNYSSTQKNRLSQVQDYASNTASYSAELDLPNQPNGNNYVYNHIGELIENKQEGRGYEYNAAGLVTRIYQLSNNGTLSDFTYNDKGLRHKKVTYAPGPSSVPVMATYYSYDAGGMQVASYERDLLAISPVTVLKNHTLYGVGRTGLRDAATGTAMFELNDHLGNVRAVVAANSTTGAAETISYTDYYPHGGTMPGRDYTSSLNFPYGYQGQEKDANTGLTNFELRQYDPRIGRWYNPDPYGQHHSPYLAMSNNPVSVIDPDGGWDDPGGPEGKGPIVHYNDDGMSHPSNISDGLGNSIYWNTMNPYDRQKYQAVNGTSYGAQEKNRILDLATLGNGYKMKDGGYFSLNNGKVTVTDYMTNNFNYLTGRTYNTDGTTSETYAIGSYVSSTSKTYGEFNAAEVYGDGGKNFSYLKRTESTPIESAIAIPLAGTISNVHPAIKVGAISYGVGYYLGMNIEATTNGIGKLLVFLGVNADYLYGNYDSFAHKPKKQSTGSKKRTAGKHQKGLDRNNQKYKDKKRIQKDGKGNVKWTPNK